MRKARASVIVCIAGVLAVSCYLAAGTAYSDQETCGTCHGKVAADFAKTSHGIRADERTPAAKQSCETCHGVMTQHVEGGGGRATAKRLGRDSDLSAQERNESCLACHEKGKTALWHGSTHASNGVACADCHSIHGGNEKNLAKPVEREVCFRCHGSVKAEIKRTSHHPVEEGKMSCSDCHNPHGTIAKHNIDASTVNEKCYTCHAEKRGPYLFEHRPVVEDCSICHTPHGSNHSKLMAKKLPFQCQSCHSNSRHPGTIYAVNPATSGANTYEKLNNRILYRNCLNCHQNIHGSNHPSGKTFLR